MSCMDPVQVQVALFFIIGFPLFPCITFTVFVSSSLSLLISPLLSSFSSPLKSPSSSSPTQSRYLFPILSYYPLLLTATHSHIIFPHPSLPSSFLLVSLLQHNLYLTGSLVGAYFIGKQLPYFGPEVYYDVLTSAGTYCTYVLLYVYCTCVSLFSFTRTWYSYSSSTEWKWLKFSWN